MELTTEQKRRLEATIKEVHEKLFALKEETGYSISVSAYHDDVEIMCVFIHDHVNNMIANIDSMKKLDGYMDNPNWTSTEKEEDEDGEKKPA